MTLLLILFSGCNMEHNEQQAYFERSDKWNYRLLLQELYRNCVLSSHDSIFFIEHVKKLDIAVTNFPGLPIRDMIDRLMVPHEELYNLAVSRRKAKYDNTNSGQPVSEIVSYSFDVHDFEHAYYVSLFNVLEIP